MRIYRDLARLIVLSFVILAGSILAQPARLKFDRPSTFDVQHYILRVKFDRGQKKVIGDTTVRLKPLQDGFKQVPLDSVGIQYSSVTLEPTGVPLKYRVDEGQIVIDLDRGYSAGESIELRFRYTATPKKGVYFIPEQKAADGLPSRAPQIWTQGEPDEARHWFPSFDFPSDKATTEQFITAPANEKVIGNGTLVEKLDNADGTATHRFKMDVPFSTYLVSFVIGDYVLLTETYGKVPLSFYVYPGAEYIVPKAFGRTRDMMRIFEDLTKIEYPFPKYDQTIVASFAFGGMENITATTMADRDIFLVNTPIFEATVEDLVSHELAHSWFGNMVTCDNWAELWLNEGFATFMEAAYREKKYGRQSYIFKILSDAEQFLAGDSVSNRRHGLYNQRAGNVSTLFDTPTTTYNKGGAVLHTLREQLGDDAFWRGVNLYLTRHKWKNVRSTDLQNAMEEASGTRLGWFFDQWIYGLGSPKLDVKSVYSPRTKTLSMTVTQTQKRDAMTPPSFRLPLDVEFAGISGPKAEKIEVTKRIETFRFKLSGKPSKIILDKGEKVPLKTLKIAAIANGK